jgi:fatty acid desaturase
MQAAVNTNNRFDIFRHKEDRWPVAIILLLTIIDFALYFAVDSVVVLSVYYVLMIVPKGIICAWNHHHQHVSTLRNKPLNRILEFFYALHTGVTTHLWRLHHVLGHHLNFLDQSKDESRWQRKDGSQMGVVEYTIKVGITAYPRGFSVGRRYPKQLKPFILFTAFTFLAVAVLVWYKPVAGTFLFVLPMITSLFFTAYVTYDHHTGLDTESEFEASYNNLNPFFNFITGNLGYHTAHHHKQGVHWSKLPALHAKIADKIPEYLYQRAIVTHRA